MPEMLHLPASLATVLTVGAGSYAMPGCAGGTWLDTDLHAKLLVDAFGLGGLGPDGYREIITTDNHWSAWAPGPS